MNGAVEQDWEVGMRKITLLLIGIFIVACARDPVNIDEDQAGGTLRNLMQYQEDGNYAFDCSVTGFVPTSYGWDFGDGAKRVTDHKGVAHTYNESGTYFVSCTASDGSSSITTNTTVTVALPQTLREDVEALSDVYPPNSYTNTTDEFDLGLFEDLDAYEQETPRSDFDEFEEYDWEDDDTEWESIGGLDEIGDDTGGDADNSTNGTTDTGYGTASGTNSTANASRTNTTLPTPINNTPDRSIDDINDDLDLDILEDDDEESDEENGESGPAGGRDNGDDEDAPGMDEEEQEDRKNREQRDEKAEVAPKSKKIKVEVLLP